MKPHNPGLGEQAWRILHKFVARMMNKYNFEFKEDSTLESTVRHNQDSSGTARESIPSDSGKEI